MPIYAYKCDRGHRAERLRTVADRNKPVRCPDCPGYDLCKGMTRDLQAEHGPNRHKVYGADFDREEVSQSLGIMPEQIPEAKARFPHHRFNEKGDMLFANSREYDRVRRDLGE